MPTPQTVDFELICVDFPDPEFCGHAAIRLGIQERRTVQQQVLCPTDQATFSFSLQAIPVAAEDTVIWRGSYAQGTVQERFVYLCWEGEVDGVWQIFRRAKIPLRNIPATLVEEVLREPRPIQARIQMRTAKGEPVAATLKPNFCVWG